MSVLLAFSTGPDSVYLLEKLPKTNLHALYCNHHLRPKSELKEDLKIITYYQEKYPKVTFQIVDLDVKKFAKTHKRNLEDAARHLRYQALVSYAKANNLAEIATAHHLDDHVETLMMQLLRGTGVGFKGILPKSTTNGIPLIRPLLEISKKEILSFLAKKNRPFSIDSTNSDTTLLRNRLRHEVLPLLNSLNPKFGNHLSKLASDWQEVQNVMSSLLDSLKTQIKQNKDHVFIPKSLLISQPPIIQKQLILDTLKSIYKKPVPLRAILNQVCQSLATQDPTTHHLPEGVRVLVNKNGLFIYYVI